MKRQEEELEQTQQQLQTAKEMLQQARAKETGKAKAKGNKAADKLKAAEDELKAKDTIIAKQLCAPAHCRCSGAHVDLSLVGCSCFPAITAPGRGWFLWCHTALELAPLTRLICSIVQGESETSQQAVGGGPSRFQVRLTRSQAQPSDRQVSFQC